MKLNSTGTYPALNVQPALSHFRPFTPISFRQSTCVLMHRAIIDKQGRAPTLQFNPPPPRSTLSLSFLHRELNSPFRIPHFFPTTNMSDPSGQSHLQVMFEAALRDYEKQTGIALAKHPLAEQLQNCDSVESVTAVLREQTQAFKEFRGNDKVLKPLKMAVSVLHKLSATPNFGQDVGLVSSSALTRCLLSMTLVL